MTMKRAFHSNTAYFYFYITFTMFAFCTPALQQCKTVKNDIEITLNWKPTLLTLTSIQTFLCFFIQNTWVWGIVGLKKQTKVSHQDGLLYCKSSEATLNVLCGKKTDRKFSTIRREDTVVYTCALRSVLHTVLSDLAYYFFYI